MRERARARARCRYNGETKEGEGNMASCEVLGD